MNILKLPVFLIIVLLNIFQSNAIEILDNKNETASKRFGPQTRVDMNINNRVDAKLVALRTVLLQNGYDPLDIPDIEQSFEIRPILITYHGKLKLKKGWLQDMRTITRLGDAYVKIGIGQKQLARLSLVIPNLEFGFDYSAKFMHLGPTGSIIGNVKDIQIYLELYYYVIQDYYQLVYSDLYDIGVIDLKLSGNILTDPIANLFIGIVTNIVHETVVSVVNSTIYNVIDDINEILHPKLLH
ncbi:mite allergen Der p 7-like [Chrysoperla carnea]|uniref:mite allergen Der p 7-like n=1 Tax=Chrysoperla carnea TaxID=189513 RepID=UPI001D06E30B|nr:mite allergen Der p 7-like [Chrysoperla carnea]